MPVQCVRNGIVLSGMVGRVAAMLLARSLRYPLFFARLKVLKRASTAERGRATFATGSRYVILPVRERGALKVGIFYRSLTKLILL